MIKNKTKKLLFPYIGVAVRGKSSLSIGEQIDFCRKHKSSHLQLQMRRLSAPLSKTDTTILREFLKEGPIRSLSSHLSSPEFDAEGRFINKNKILAEIDEISTLPVKKITIHPGKFESTDEEMRKKILPHLSLIVQHAKQYSLITCFENQPYKIWKDPWQQKFGVTPQDLTWLRNAIIAADASLEQFCKFTLDIGHVGSSNEPFRMAPEKFAEQLGWEHIAIIHANDAEHFKKLHGFSSEEGLNEIFQKRMKNEPDNKELQTIQQMIGKDPYLKKTYEELLAGLDTVRRAHVPLAKGTINWTSFWKAYLKNAPQRPEIYLELSTLEEIEESLQYFLTA